MLNISTLILTVFISLTWLHSGELSKYKAIDAYEIRPGIMMLPRYADDGQVCEVGLEQLRYSRKGASLEFTLSQKAIDDIVDELAPATVRGPKPTEQVQITGIGSGYGETNIDEYKNVTVTTFALSEQKCNEGMMVAIIKWKNRKCRE